MPFRVTKPRSRTTSRDEARDRLKEAVQAYEEGEGSLSISQAARLYVVSKTTLYNRIHGRRDQASYGVTKQRLTREEEESIKGWVLDIQSWGFPPRVSQLREMAEELLQARGDYKELGVNWISGFLTRHPTLQSKYSRTLDQERFLAQDPVIIQHWFDLYQSIKAKHGILDEDTYNMDENGYMMGMGGSSKVVFSKYQKQAFIKQAGNREWASLIEAVGTSGRQLPLFVIFKGKKWKDDWFTKDMQAGDRISLSENGWTDNKLCIEWLKDCFEPATRTELRGEYRLLIVDGHASHVSNEFIKFVKANKIVCLCLPPHSTHLLQPLDVSVFGPLKQNYKKLLAEKTRFTTYNIDKVDFISLIQQARRQGISSRNIQSAWRATGLIPYNPAVVFQKLSIRPEQTSTSSSTDNTSNTPLQTRYFTGRIPPTPANIQEVSEVEELVSLFRNQTLDSPKLTILHKTLKAARRAMADRVILNRTNTELLEANTRKKRRAQRTGLQYDGQYARVLSLEDVEKRRELAEEKKRDKEAKIEEKRQKQGNRDFLAVTKSLMRLGPDLLYGPIPSSSTVSSSKNTTGGISSTRHKNRNDLIVTSAFRDLLQISPDIFQEFDLDDLVSKKPVLAKEKGVSKRKKTPRSIQNELGVVGKKKEEEILANRISTRGRIIRNTRKM